MSVFSNRSQKTLTCDKNIGVHPIAVSLTWWWRPNNKVKVNVWIGTCKISTCYVPYPSFFSMVDVHLQTLPSCRRMTTNHPVFPFPVKETDALPLIQRDKTKWPFTSSVISWQHRYFAHCLWVWIKKLTPTFTCAFLDIKGEYNIIHFFFKCCAWHSIALQDYEEVFKQLAWGGRFYH